MTAADLPPSSRLTFVRLAAHAAATARPAAVDPVKDTLRCHAATVSRRATRLVEPRFARCNRC
jgi:hypothetical protein